MVLCRGEGGFVSGRGFMFFSPLFFFLLGWVWSALPDRIGRGWIRGGVGGVVGLLCVEGMNLCGLGFGIVDGLCWCGEVGVCWCCWLGWVLGGGRCSDYGLFRETEDGTTSSLPDGRVGSVWG